MELERDKISQKRAIDIELDNFEKSLETLRIQYEQHFVGLNPIPPTELYNFMKRERRRLINAPFKNTESRFRLRMLLQRFLSYDTYWERINKEREEGTFRRDRFITKVHTQWREQDRKERTSAGAAEKGLRELFNSYQAAVEKSGGRAEHIDFTDFKKSIVEQTKHIKQATGAKKLSYKVVIKDGHVSLKAVVASQN